MDASNQNYYYIFKRNNNKSPFLDAHSEYNCCGLAIIFVDAYEYNYIRTYSVTSFLSIYPGQSTLKLIKLYYIHTLHSVPASGELSRQY